jgi:hypothetical protein
MVLLDDGQLLITRTHFGQPMELELVRMATASPGLARTAWPTHHRDNARTGWIAAW